MRQLSRRLASRALGVGAGTLTVIVALDYVLRWSQLETLRTPPVSQVGFFYGVLLFAALGVLQVGLALRPPSPARAAAMTAFGFVLVIDGARASGALDETGLWFFYVGLLTLVGAAFALVEVPKRLVPAIAGLLASVPVLVFIYWSGATVSGLFP